MDQAKFILRYVATALLALIVSLLVDDLLVRGAYSLIGVTWLGLVVIIPVGAVLFWGGLLLGIAGAGRPLGGKEGMVIPAAIVIATRPIHFVDANNPDIAWMLLLLEVITVAIAIHIPYHYMRSPHRQAA